MVCRFEEKRLVQQEGRGFVAVTDRMRDRAMRFFGIVPDDVKPMMLIQCLIITLCAVLACIKAVAGALFVFHVGVGFLPNVFVISAAAMMVFWFWLKRLIDDVPIARLFAAALWMAAALFAISVAGMRAGLTWIYHVSYVLMSVADAALLSLFWKVAVGACGGKRVGRIAFILGAGALLGGVIGSILAKILLSRMTASTLLLYAAGSLIVMFIPFWRIRLLLPESAARRARGTWGAGGADPAAPSGAAQPPTEMDRWRTLKSETMELGRLKLARLLYATLILAALLSSMADLVFNVVVVWKLSMAGEVDSGQLTSVIAFFDAIGIGMSLVVQLFLARLVTQSLGDKNSHLLLPGVYSCGFGVIFAGAVAQHAASAFGCGVGARLGRQTISGGIHKAAMFRISDAIPAKTSSTHSLVESIFSQIGLLLSGFVILFMKTLPMMYVALLAAALAALYLFLMFRLRAAYVEQEIENERLAKALAST